MARSFVRSLVGMQLQDSQEDSENVNPFNEVAASTMHCVPSPISYRLSIHVVIVAGFGVPCNEGKVGCC